VPNTYFDQHLVEDNVYIPFSTNSEARKLQIAQQQLEGSQDTGTQMRALNQGINLVWKLGKLEVKQLVLLQIDKTL